ncbi:hypothetical protein [Caloranaerobacter sp. DY30410]|uniref:hypothetical protein n=1 Tax=Caloranaerobacter sp. DY30410 TaxID=3238305 RepID=UPI003D037443
MLNDKNYYFNEDVMILIKTIKKDIESSEKIMTVEEVNQLYSKLQKYALADGTVKKAHVDNIQKIF